jgi:hypothetical protein
MIKFKEVRYLSVSIELEPEAVYAFISNPENLPQWASSLGQGVKRAGEHWEVKTQQGTVGLRFTPYNKYGVLDHIYPQGTRNCQRVAWRTEATE